MWLILGIVSIIFALLNVIFAIKNKSQNGIDFVVYH